MTAKLKLGSKVRLLHDDGWGSPGCVMACSGDRLCIYWPDENVFTHELAANLVPYQTGVASQPWELVA